ncbi:homoserine acetyltransferase [Mollisia scopiformis]|uniref:Homoserine acetyltransferase n=1 Tax=Mollisia scopiformis TaxID=149040 RepID=A0A194X5W4_MOLSC|nr:homoserine acetyltransferase [Mollisia scopiformis]KUJ15187.1 homoserine acetyltransferase [Mollisia scopiformis]
MSLLCGTPANLAFPAKLAFRTFGDASNPAILLPTCFNGKIPETLSFLYSNEDSSDAVLSPSKYFIIISGLLGGGESSSPSNTPEPFHGPNLPRTTYEDNVRFQHALCQKLGVRKLFAYIGFSMGGQQAYHMSTLFPDFVQNMICLAGSARTSWHSQVVLQTLSQALLSSPDFRDGQYTEPPMQGLKAMDRIFATWAFSSAWYRQRRWEAAGYGNLEEYLDDWWSGDGEANDLLAMLWTWQNGDISVYYPEDGGDLEKTLGRIKARCLVMPSSTDQFCAIKDSEEEVKSLKYREFRCVQSVYGHLAGGGMGTKEDTDFLVQEIRRFLAAGKTNDD